MSFTNKQNHTLYQHPQETPFKSAYSTKQKQTITFPSNSRWTKQSFKDECDINTIMGRYMRTGEMPMINVSYPQYLDVTGADFQAHMNVIAGAQSLFNELPSDVRTRFKNDPAQFLDFVSNENNRLELAQMGLLSHEITSSILTPQPAQTNASNVDSANPPKTDA